jgi:hypothetical protein
MGWSRYGRHPLPAQVAGRRAAKPRPQPSEADLQKAADQHAIDRCMDAVDDAEAAFYAMYDALESLELKAARERLEAAENAYGAERQRQDQRRLREAQGARDRRFAGD